MAMTSPVVTVNERMGLHKAYRMFRQMGMRHLTVVNNDGVVVGIVTRKDLEHAAHEAAHGGHGDHHDAEGGHGTGESKRGQLGMQHQQRSMIIRATGAATEIPPSPRAESPMQHY